MHHHQQYPDELHQHNHTKSSKDEELCFPKAIQEVEDSLEEDSPVEEDLWEEDPSVEDFQEEEDLPVEDSQGEAVDPRQEDWTTNLSGALQKYSMGTAQKQKVFSVNGKFTVG